VLDQTPIYTSFDMFNVQPWTEEDDPQLVFFNHELDGIVSHIQHSRVTND